MAREHSRTVAEHLGANLLRIRRREGLSQEQLAERASLHRGAIGLLEHGKRVCRADTLIQLAGAMAVAPAELLDGIAWVPGPETDGAFALSSMPTAIDQDQPQTSRGSKARDPGREAIHPGQARAVKPASRRQSKDDRTSFRGQPEDQQQNPSRTITGCQCPLMKRGGRSCFCAGTVDHLGLAERSNAVPSSRVPPLMTEVEQEIGRKGVKRFRRLLDGTMRFNMSWDIYENAPLVALPLLASGKTKTFDLGGLHTDDDGETLAEIFVEAKNYKDAGSQSAEFSEFLANAYSATMRKRDDINMDPKWEFMWATMCPWKGTGFRQVASREALRSAVGTADEAIIPADHDIDEGMITALAQRLWVWVVCERHEDMILGGKMRGVVAAAREEGK
jgi:transcriptional regulator with XRE-family HTH domain